MAGRHLTLIGAGMTGRGQVAQLAFEDGWSLTLVDRDRALVDALQRAGRYTVRLLSGSPREVTIAGYEALHTSEREAIAQAVDRADLVVTSVLEPNLPEVAETLAAALAARLARGEERPLQVIAAENMEHSSTVLRRLTWAALPARRHEALDRLVGFPDSMIARVVPISPDPLYLSAEEYSEWTADRQAAVGEPPALDGLEWVEDQAARLRRKLYLHNCGHAVCGYLGWLRGYRLVHEAAADPHVMAAVRHAIAESGTAVCAEHGFDREQTREYEENLCLRLVLSDLPDEISRVIRQPLRKLRPGERLVGPLQLCERHGLPAEGLCRGVAAVLACRMPGEEQFDLLARTVEAAGPLGALVELVGYSPPPALAERILRHFQAGQRGPR